MLRSAETMRREVTEPGATLARLPWHVRLLSSQKSLGYEAGDTNLYRYVGNTPTSALDPRGLASVTAKSVPWPQTGFLDGAFYFYWGVALYIDDAGLKELAEAVPPGGYIVSKRTLTWKIGDNSETSQTAWHLNQIVVKDGKLVANDNYGNPAGGARSMADGSTALTYFSVINTPANKVNVPIGYTEKTGKVTVELSWKLYKCAPDAATKKKFPENEQARSTIGWDEYVHTMWTGKDPAIKEKHIAEGKIDGTITWKAPNEHTFTSSNKDIPSGPNRPRGMPYFPEWEYKGGMWIRH